MKKDTPVLFARKEECCGCTACYSICPVGAISMSADEEGFLYPRIDAELCIGCRQCIRVCPLKAAETSLP
ncbi:MAG: 4Fe-4S binding protein [Oscillospiraceae bacterium]|jgi:ferredoxin|nr:4Fe-4S binding protein [Oscillospiraceae bacterium]